MQAELAFPMALRGRPFRVREALHRGISPGRLRSKALLRPFHGIRTWVQPRTHEERARAVLPRLRPDQAFSHTTAAVILGLPLPRRLERDLRIHVTTIGPDQALRVRGTIGHRAREGRVRTVHSGTATLTHPADTFIALATLLNRDELIVVGDALVGWRGWCDRDELIAAARRYRGARGIRRVRAALAEIRPGSRSPGETRLRLAMTRRGLPQPALNHDVVVDGRWVACVDLAYPAARVAIEYESDLHRTDDRTFRKDLTRGELLKDAGWWLVRATADDVGAAIDTFVARVRRLIDGASAGRHDSRPTRRSPSSG
ncbi:hypothetical protein [Curtobacterium pusillum]|uniref:hypothetical protein n=1 Tax=Curtobacterium pusillum TaxID=69373 RepID=UPI0011A0CC49|nr:hypothetical protein [Curtobacterium pusillum]